MSIRNFLADQSQQIEIDGVVYPVVSVEDLTRAMAEAAIVLHRAGGCLYVDLQRKPTGIEGEYVTIAALLSWRDRPSAKAQPEVERVVVEQPAGAEQPPAEENGNGDLTLTDAQYAALPDRLKELVDRAGLDGAPPPAAPAEAIGDGLDALHGSELVDETSLV